MDYPAFNSGKPPETICLVRLSAIGDVTHILPIINTIRSHWPQVKITWIIGKTELELVHDLPGVEFIAFDKSRGIRAYLDLRRQLRERHFDVLLLMQLSVRANLIPLFVKAPIKIGFDRARSKNIHGLFVNHRIEAKPDQHVLDSFFGFSEALGISDKRLAWDLCCSEEDLIFAESLLPTTPQRTLLISPCSNHPRRNWTPEGYAEIADYAAETHAMRVVITGGKSDRGYGQMITAAMRTRALDLIGRTTLRQLMAVITRADIMISPDSGPAHLATCAGKPVIGLYAATNPNRATPYLSKQWCVNRYPDAVRQYLGRDWRTIRWGTRVKKSGVMDLITAADVREKLDAWA